MCQVNNVTVLFLTVKYSDLEIVDLLLNSNTDVSSRDYEGRTVLYMLLTWVMLVSWNTYSNVSCLSPSENITCSGRSF